MADETKKRILLVEDDSFLSNLLRVRFQKEGIDVVLAKDGEEAIKKMIEDSLSLVLLDLILPKKSGFEVLEQISSDPQIANVPVIIISNLGQTSDIERGKSLGAIEYFVKAKVSINDLVEKIKEYINK